MKNIRLLPWLLGVLISAAFTAVAAGQQLKYPWQPEEPQGYQNQTWHDGFRAGATAANLDLGKKLAPDLNRHPGYRTPDLAPVAGEEFRAGFEYAYQAVVDHRFSPGAGYVPHYSGYYEADSAANAPQQ